MHFFAFYFRHRNILMALLLFICEVSYPAPKQYGRLFERVKNGQDLINLYQKNLGPKKRAEFRAIINSGLLKDLAKEPIRIEPLGNLEFLVMTRRQTTILRFDKENMQFSFNGKRYSVFDGFEEFEKISKGYAFNDSPQGLQTLIIPEANALVVSLTFVALFMVGVGLGAVLFGPEALEMFEEMKIEKMPEKEQVRYCKSLANEREGDSKLKSGVTKSSVAQIRRWMAKMAKLGNGARGWVRRFRSALGVTGNLCSKILAKSSAEEVQRLKQTIENLKMQLASVEKGSGGGSGAAQDGNRAVN